MRDLPSAGELELIAIRVSLMAAAIVAEGVGRSTRLGAKSSPTDIVTDIDLASETAIRTQLAIDTPDCGIIGEEHGDTEPRARLQWIVDPLDGTVNFSYGAPIFSVSIAAAIDGEIVAGAVVDAIRGDVFSATRSHGARCNNKRIAVTGCDQLSQALIATGFSYQPDLRALQGDVIRQLLPIARDIRCFGSAALNLCWVGAGWVDGYFERDTKLWDYAAGSLIAQEAGAIIELPCPENEGLSIATAPGIFENLRNVVETPTNNYP